MSPRRRWLQLLVGLCLAGAVSACGSSQPEALSAEARRAQAQKLRQSVPEPVELPGSGGASGEGSAVATTQGGGGSVVPAAEAIAPMPTTLADDPALVLGDYELIRDGKAIVDGDTIKVEGLDASLRLLGFDAEETFKKDEHRSAALSNFAAYSAEMRGDSPFPVKYGTPMGEAAREWAEDFFAGHSTVRLEYDELGRQRGVYGRYLVYVFVKKNGEWVNYNVEAVRAGMAPYFAKYGNSKRFHDDFVAAQDEARAARRGIWGEEVDHYPDYDERLAWWTRRADAIAGFHANHAADETYFELGLDSEWDRMASYVGQPVTVFGTVGDVLTDKSPALVRLSHKRGMDFTIVAFEQAELEALDVGRFDGEYVYVRGVLSTYRDKYQFKAAEVEKIWTE